MAKAKQPSKLNLSDSIRRHFVSLGGVELKLPPREAVRPPPKLGKRVK
jgi:hypothetical protein